MIKRCILDIFRYSAFNIKLRTALLMDMSYSYDLIFLRVVKLSKLLKLICKSFLSFHLDVEDDY